MCVFCGSQPGKDPAFAETGRALGAELARRGIRLVYGGASHGLMGVVADAALAGGGEVVGVLPAGLFPREVAHMGLTELHMVGSMHERKALMNELSDAFVAMPGGFGTLEELMEVTTWAQLGIHRKPVGVLDVLEFFNPMRAQFDRAWAEGFLNDRDRQLIHFHTSPSALLDAIDQSRDT